MQRAAGPQRKDKVPRCSRPWELLSLRRGGRIAFRRRASCRDDDIPQKEGVGWGTTSQVRFSIRWPCSSGLSPSLPRVPPPFGYDIGHSTIQAIALVVLTVHLVPYVVDRRGIKSTPGPGSPSSQMLGWAGLLLEVTSPVSLMNCTDNTVRPFSHNSQNRLCSSGDFELTHVSSVCRHLRTHRSGPRINRQPCRLQSHLCAWNRTLERPLL